MAIPTSVTNISRGGGKVRMSSSSFRDPSYAGTGGQGFGMTKFGPTQGQGMTNVQGGGGPAGDPWEPGFPGGAGFYGGIDTDAGAFSQLEASGYPEGPITPWGTWGSKAPAGGNPGNWGTGMTGQDPYQPGEFGPGGPGGYGSGALAPTGSKPWIGGDTLDDPGFGFGDGGGPVYYGDDPGEFGPGGPGGYAGTVGIGGNVHPPPIIGGATEYGLDYGAAPTLFQARGRKLCDPRDPNCYG